MERVRQKLSVVFLTFLCGSALGSLASTLDSVKTSFQDKFLISQSKDPSAEASSSKNESQNRIQALVEAGRYSLNVQLTSRYQNSNAEALRLEKKTLSARWDSMDLLLGDAHKELGRGIALSLYEDELFGLDTTLEGISVGYHRGNFEASLVGGRLNSVQIPVTLQSVQDPLANRTVWLGASAASVALQGGGSVGVHHVLLLNQPERKLPTMGSGVFDKTHNVAGLYWNQPNLSKDLDSYAETDFLLTQNLKEGRYAFNPTGVAAYGALVWTPVPFRLKLEAKSYTHYSLEFQRPPTLEVDFVETLNNHDVWGTRLTAEYLNLESLSQYSLSYLVGEDLDRQVNIHHWVGGWSFPSFGKTKWDLSVGYRTLPGLENMAHGSVKVSFPTWGQQFVDFQFRKEYKNLDLNRIPDWEDKNIFHLGYSFSRAFQMGLGYEFVPFNDAVVGRNFAHLTSEVKTGGFVGKLLVGQTSGGTLCSGGVCRQRPPFSGALLETSYIF